MSLSDPIADMLTRIRNAQKVALPSVTMPSSTQKEAIAKSVFRPAKFKGNAVRQLVNQRITFKAPGT